MTKGIFSLLLLFTSCFSLAHSVYAPNDIPLLDNRFRIDPNAEQVTFILNHSHGPQRVVLVRPDGSKLYQRRSPESVAWVSTKTTDIITIDNPMPGPWQAIAKLDGDNRIKILSKVELKTSKLPLKLYSREYITTYASLYHEGKVMRDEHYLDGAKLSISLVGNAIKQLTLYQDDGKGYDALPFDGELTARVFIDLVPDRYLLNIKTKNDVFIRNNNYDAVVFPQPIIQKVNLPYAGDKTISLEYEIDTTEIDAQSVIINGIITNMKNEVVAQVIADKNDMSENKLHYTSQEMEYDRLLLKTEVFATTVAGREIELQLADAAFELFPMIVEPSLSPTVVIEETELIIPEETSIWSNVWVITGIIVSILLIVMLLIFFVIRRIIKKKQASIQLNIDNDLFAPVNLNDK